MAVQMNTEQHWSNDPGNLFGILAYVLALVSYLVQNVWPLGYSDFESFIVPALPWSVCIFGVVQSKAKSLRAYWWVLPSAIPALFGSLFVAFLILFWSLFGFAP